MGPSLADRTGTGLHGGVRGAERGMSLVYLVLGVVALERLGELALAARNTRRLRAAGAIELDASAYPLFVLLHGAWLASMALFVPASAPAAWPLLGAFAALQFRRIGVIASLGRYWTTRLMVLPDHPLIASGPYRFLRHPNYLIVIGEIAVLPLAVGAVPIATVFSLGNLALIARRVAIRPMTLVRQIDRMEDAGCIERRAVPADRRARGLFLTAKARPILSRIMDVATETRDEAMVRLKPAEAQQLIGLLERVHATLSERVPQPSAESGTAPIPPPRRAAVARAARHHDADTTPAPVAAVEVAR